MQIHLLLGFAMSSHPLQLLTPLLRGGTESGTAVTFSDGALYDLGANQDPDYTRTYGSDCCFGFTISFVLHLPCHLYV